MITCLLIGAGYLAGVCTGVALMCILQVHRMREED